MKRFTRKMLASVAHGMRLAAEHYGREAKAAREQGFPTIAAACQSKVSEYQALEKLFTVGAKTGRGPKSPTRAAKVAR